MGNINAAGIWTPDETDNLDPEVWSAAMADSIMHGLGERLNKQEQIGGVKVSLPGDWSFSGNFNAVPLGVSKGSDFVEGFDFEGGYAVCKVPGLYTVDCSITMDFASGVPVDMTLMFNSAMEDYVALETTMTSYTTAPISTALRLAENDTVYLAVGVGNSQTNTLNMKYAKLVLSLQYAT